MKKVLVADDRPEVLELVKVTLEGEDYEVLCASDGKEALEKIGLERPDLVLLDVVMPKMDGFEVLSKIREDPKTKDTPVIMLTAQGQKVEQEEGRRLCYLDYNTKPISLSHLLNKIEEILT